MRPVYGEVHRLEHRRLERRIAEQAERVARHGAVVARTLQRVGHRVVSLDQALRLREITDATIVRTPAGSSLLDAVSAEQPDVIIVDMARPDRDALESVRLLTAAAPKPIVMFADENDRPSSRTRSRRACAPTICPACPRTR